VSKSVYLSLSSKSKIKTFENLIKSLLFQPVKKIITWIFCLKLMSIYDSYSFFLNNDAERKNDSFVKTDVIKIFPFSHR